jgi:hypothetical protein
LQRQERLPASAINGYQMLTYGNFGKVTMVDLRVCSEDRVVGCTFAQTNKICGADTKRDRWHKDKDSDDRTA